MKIKYLKVLAAFFCFLALAAQSAHAVETPTGIYFDEVSTTSIVASGYVASGFTGLETGSAGVNVAKDGTYSTWRNGNIWTAKAATPSLRAFTGVGVIGGRMYVVGGAYDNGSAPLTTNEEYDPVANTWSTKASMPSGQKHPSAGVIGGKLYAVGGWDGGDQTNINHEYDPAANTWAIKAVMPTARGTLSAGVINDKLYAVGGYKNGYLAPNEEYDPAVNAWTTKAAMPTARAVFASGVIGGKLYAVGGENVSVLNTNEEYDPVANTWSTKAVMPTARNWLSAGVIGGKLYAVGGTDGPNRINTNEEYDPAANVWSTKAAMPTVRGLSTAGVISGRLYYCGGNGSVDGVSINTNVEYDPGVAHSFAGLTPNTQYAFKAKARDSSAVETAETAVVSTYTLAAVPAAASTVFTSFSTASFVINWQANGNPSATLYRAQISASSAFTSVTTSDTYNLSATFTGLTVGTTYYARAAAINGNGIITSYAALGSTSATGVSVMTVPTGIYFDEVTSTAIVASGYASAGFTGLQTGSAGVNVAKDGTYSTWRNGNIWTAKTAMPTARWYTGTGVIGGKLYVVGGQNTVLLNKNEEYDPVSDTWSTKAVMPAVRYGMAAGVINGKLYAVGGGNASTQDSKNEEYDPVSNTWSSKAAMSAVRMFFSAGVINGKLYAIGGYINSAIYLNLNEEYDPVLNTWSTKVAMPTARCWLSVGTIGGKLYAVGGSPAAGVVLNTNEEYDPASDTWSTKAGMSVARDQLAAVGIGGKLYAMGGTPASNSVTLNTNEEYDPAANAWSTKTVMTTARADMGAGVIGGKLYVSGGVSGSAALNTNEEYDPGVAHSFTGLTPNTQYSFKSKARDSSGVETAETATVSTYTLAAIPAAASTVFTPVYTSSLTVNWLVNGNPAATLYRAQISVSSVFASVTTSDTYATSATFTGLTSGTSYYARVAAINGNGILTNYAALGSTRTVPVSAMTAPTGVYFDDISSASIVASGYASAGFTGLQTGSVGVNVAKNGTYSTWRNGNLWTSKTAMPIAHGYLAAGVIGGKLYAVGGQLTGSTLNTNAEYDPASNTWATKAAMPTVRNALAAGVIGGKLYAVGGGNSSGAYLNTNEEYDPESNTWTTKAAMPTARAWLAAGVIGGKLYAVGGSDLSNYLNTNEEYDPAVNTWATKAVMPMVRNTLSAGVIGGKLYAVGGYDGGAGFLNTNEEFDPAANTWTTKAVMPTARGYLSAGVIGGKLYAVGGDAGSNYLNANQEYDPAVNTWATKAVMPTARSTMALGVIGGKLYAVGGGNGSIYLNTNQEYDPGVAHSFAALTPNTQYSFKAKARDSSGIETAETSVVSTYTLAAVPAAASTVFTSVSATALTANWLANGNPSGTLFRAQLSADSAFASVTTSDTYATNTTFTGLTSGTSYYARISAQNHDGVWTSYAALGSTLTTPVSAMTTPTGVYFDDISSTSIVASGYASAGFTGLQNGSAGVNVAKDEVYSTWRNGNVWTSKTAMPTTRNGLSGGVIGGKLYAVGGWNGSGYLNTNEEYDPAVNTWTTKTAMPTAREFIAAGVIGGKLYAVGGWNGSYLNVNQEYDPAANTWATKMAMPTARHTTATGVIGGKLYVVGGYGVSNNYLNTNEEYDPVANTWATKSVMPTARDYFSAAAIGGKLYAVGGTLTNTTGLNTNEEYDPAANTWATKAVMPTARFYLSAGIIGGKLYAVGGAVDPSNDSINTNEEYDPASNTWATKAAIPTSRSYFAFGLLGGKLYAVGGSEYSGGMSNTNEEYDPGVAHSFTGLVPNTQYSFKAKARDSSGIETAETSVVSTYTLAAIPAAASTVFTPIYASSFTVNWLVNGNPSGTLYRAQISASSAFTSVTTSDTYNTAAAFTGLTSGTAYYARVSAQNHNGIWTDYAALGNTVTLTPSAMTAPTGVYFDDISSTSIVASGYAAAGFTGLQTGSAGVNVAKNGTYSTWRNGNIWNTKAAMSSARAFLAAGVIGGKLYAMGGNSAMHANEEYDPATNTWATKAAMPTDRLMSSAGIVSGKLYVVGGLNGNWFNTNEEYDPASNTWSTKAAMPTARGNLASGVIGGKLYAVGGQNGGWPNTNEEYDPASNTWTTKTAIPTARYGLSAGVIGDKLYVVGGDYNGGRLNTNEEYNPASNTWTTKAAMPTAREGSSAGVIGGKLYAMGGQNSGGSESNTNEGYDPVSNIWVTKAVMPTVRYGLSAGVIGGKLYAVGGANGSGNLNTNEEYDPGVAHSFTGLTPNTQYSFKAKARDSSGAETAETATVSTYTLAAIPAPGSPIFTAIAGTTFTSNWLANGNPAGTVYRAQISASSAFTTVTTSNTTGTSAVFTGLTNNTLYYVRVAAINGNGVMTSYLSLGSVTATAGNNPPSLSWTGETNYTADGLNPEIGVSTTPFEYRVKYMDANNDAPYSGTPKVHITKGGSEIAGSPFLMAYVSGANNTGAIYTYSRTLDAAGSDYSYYFEAQDANIAGATGSPTSAVDAPDVNNSVSGDRQEGFKTTLGDNLFSPRSGGTSKIKFNVATAGKVSLKIYDLSGRLVRTLYEGDSPAGDTQRDWNGRDDSGRHVIPSVYFLHYVHPGGKEVRRIGVRK